MEAEEAAGGTVGEAKEEHRQEDVLFVNDQPPPEEEAREATVEEIPAATVNTRSTMEEVPATMVEASEEEEGRLQGAPLKTEQPPPEERGDSIEKTSIVKTVKAQSIRQPSKLVTSLSW